MLRWALQEVRIRRTSRHVVATLEPLVRASRRRLNDIPASAWLDPYVLGFMAMLITVVARAEVRSLSDIELAALQGRAWSALTDMNADLFGPEVMALAEARNEAFLSGCRDAESVFASLDVFPPDARDVIDGEQIDMRLAAARAWEATFDNRMTALPRSSDRYT